MKRTSNAFHSITYLIRQKQWISYELDWCKVGASMKRRHMTVIEHTCSRELVHKLPNWKLEHHDNMFGY